MGEGTAVREPDPFAPVVIANPGAEFQDEARPGAMIIGNGPDPEGAHLGLLDRHGGQTGRLFPPRDER